MEFLRTREEIDEKKPCFELMEGNDLEETSGYFRDKSVFLPFDAFNGNMDTFHEIIEVMELYLGIDYYGCVSLAKENWLCFLSAVESLEVSETKELLEGITEEFDEFVSKSVEKYGKFYFVGL